MHINTMWSAPLSFALWTVRAACQSTVCNISIPCADPGIFVRGGGGGGGFRSIWEKELWQRFFSPQLILQKSNGIFQRKLSLYKVPDGVQHFPEGVQLFQGGGGGGSNCIFPIETHITCDFPGGGGRSGPPAPPPPPSLDQHLNILASFCSLADWFESGKAKDRCSCDTPIPNSYFIIQ